MIRLTPVQSQVLISLGTLTREQPNQKWFTTRMITEHRLIATNKKSNQTFYRTTQNALNQMNKHVPQITTHSVVGWRLTPSGLALVDTQLGVRLGELYNRRCRK